MAVSEDFRSLFRQHPLHKALDIELVEQRPGFARIELHPGPVTTGGVGGSVHGGVLAALVDIVMLAALSQTFEGKQPAGTADLNITYLRPALGDPITAEAEVVKNGRRLAMIEVSILAPDGRLCAKGRTLYAFR